MSLSYTALADTLNQKSSFFVNQKYDANGRLSLTATLMLISDHAYLYVDDDYYGILSLTGRQRLSDSLKDLGQSFDNSIYPRLRGVFGAEPNPGVDGDPRLYILVQNTQENNGGYVDSDNFSSSDKSNRKEIIFLSADSVIGDIQKAKSFLAHEFQHIISFNQKEVMNSSSEEVWLNELRSEYAITAAGFNDPFANSILFNRKESFLGNPSESLVEWPNRIEDYGIASMLGEYLVEQYGTAVLGDTVKSRSYGIRSLDDFLVGRYSNFKNSFFDWMAAVYINDTVLNSKFGYTRPELRDIHVRPQHVQPLGAESHLALDVELKPWQPYWMEFILNGFNDKAIKVEASNNSSARALVWNSDGSFNSVDLPVGGGYVSNNGSGISKLALLVTNSEKTNGFSLNETASKISLIIYAVDNIEAKSRQLIDGALIRKYGQAEMYVISGKYKRYLSPEVIRLYGHLDPNAAIEVSSDIFDSYTTSNYVKNVNQEPVYAVWSDMTRHWLNMTGEYFTSSGRDWGAIFIINDLELNLYRRGPDVTT